MKMNKEIITAITKAIKGSEQIFFFQHTEGDGRYFIGNAHVMVNGSFEDIQEILVKLKIIPAGTGQYTKVGTKYEFKERTFPLEKLLSCGINEGEVSNILLDNPEGPVRPIMYQDASILVNEAYVPIIRALLKETVMNPSIRVKESNAVFHVIHNPVGGWREIVMFIAPIVLKEAYAKNYRKTFRTLADSI